MRVDQRGIDLIKGFAGLRTTAYLDAVGVLTIGYGHTGKDVVRGQVISQARAEELLRADLARFEDGVTALAGHCTQGQFDALVSFHYNTGAIASASPFAGQLQRSRRRPETTSPGRPGEFDGRGRRWTGPSHRKHRSIGASTTHRRRRRSVRYPRSAKP